MGSVTCMVLYKLYFVLSSIREEFNVPQIYIQTHTGVCEFILVQHVVSEHRWLFRHFYQVSYDGS